MEDIISKAEEIAKALEAGDLAAAFASMLERMTKRNLKVVVIGDFKAGKSTLINRIFLRRDVLPVDYLEATAVPTHLSGGQMRMETWKRDTTTQRETLVESRENFLPEDVARVVTAHSDEERARLAKQYSKVHITVPGILPPGITLVDTPGLNTTNSDVYVNTMYEARTAHALLYVVSGRQLSERELFLLANLAGMQQPSLPIHVALTVDGSRGSGQVKTLCDTIKAQLSKVGILNCEVSVFYPNADCASGASDEKVREELEAFLRGEVQRGRQARLVRDLRPLLERLRVAVSSRLELDGKGAKEIEAIKNVLEKKRKEYQFVVHSLLENVVEAQRSFLENLKIWLEKLKAGFKEDMDSKVDATDVFEAIKTWQELLPDRIQRLLKLAQSDFNKDIKRVESQYSVQLKQIFNLPELETHSSGLTKVLADTPRWVFYTLDFAVFSLLTPTSLMADILIRFVGDKIPFIKRIMPLNLAGAAVRVFATKEFVEMVDKMEEDVASSMESQFRKMCDKLRTNLQNAGLFPEIENALEKARAARLPSTLKNTLLEAVTNIQTWIKSL